MEPGYDQARLEALACRMLHTPLTEEEQAYFDTWYNVQVVKEAVITDDNYATSEAAIKERMWQQLHQHMNKQPGKYRLLYVKPLMAAASVLLVALTAIYLYRQPIHNPAPIATTLTNNTILPGGNRAVLTLYNGKQINLTEAATGALPTGNGLRAEKDADGQVSFTANSTPAATGSNTISTPAGGQYRVQLPDGSLVWLNALSILRFPETFGTTARQVTLTGEAYFEIAPDPQRPFTVTSGTQTIEVLGTCFNVQNYPDEPGIVTTLVQGSVNLRKGPYSQQLKPGQQGITPRREDAPITVLQADMEAALAWKNGQLLFRETELAVIMRQVARWYNITVHYEGNAGREKFTGGINRAAPLNTLLDIFRESNIHFSINRNADDYVLTIMP